MKRVSLVLLSLVLSLGLSVPTEAAGTRLIVRVNGGLPVIQGICRLLGCNVNYGLGDPSGQVFLITAPSLLSSTFLATIRLQVGILSAELDLTGRVLEARASASAPAALSDHTPVNYFGTTVWRGYVNQPAAQITGVANAQNQFKVDGYGIVAVIDTGVDTTHPALQSVLLPATISHATRIRRRKKAMCSSRLRPSWTGSARRGSVNRPRPSWISRRRRSSTRRATRPSVTARWWLA